MNRTAGMTVWAIALVLACLSRAAVAADGTDASGATGRDSAAGATEGARSGVALPGAAVALLGALSGRSAEQLTALPAAPATIPYDRQVPQAMRIKRVVAGPDGKSRLDVIELPIVNAEPGKALYSRLYATDVELGYGAPGAFIDWHRVTTPRLWILLQGTWEFGTGDGQRHLLKAGDIVLAADVTGEGHTSRNIGDVPSFVLTVRLPAEDSLKPKPNAPPAR